MEKAAERTRSLLVTDSIDEVRSAVRAARAEGRRVGFVPTMGALHDGHASLIRRCVEENGFSVVSIFVNPSQFGPNEDLDRYPRTFEADRDLCESEGAGLIYAPRKESLYPEGYRTWVEVHGLRDLLEGASRPGFFRGVATIVLKLFNIVQPDAAYFGRKDAQQAAVIRTMAADLNLPVEIRVLPIVREPDGLAMSSRNAYLSPEGRRTAVVLSRALAACRDAFREGETSVARLKDVMATRFMEEKEARVDYLEVRDPLTFEERKAAGPGDLALAAAFVENVRLIDNLTLE